MELSVGELDGVNVVYVNLEVGKVDVLFDVDKVLVKDIVDVIED